MINRFELVQTEPSQERGPLIGEGVVFPSGTTALELNEGHAGDHHAGVLIHSGPDGIEDLLDEFGRDSTAVDWIDGGEGQQ